MPCPYDLLAMQVIQNGFGGALTLVYLAIACHFWASSSLRVIMTCPMCPEIWETR
jgi:hypothetical protein